MIKRASEAYGGLSKALSIPALGNLRVEHTKHMPGTSLQQTGDPRQLPQELSDKIPNLCVVQTQICLQIWALTQLLLSWPALQHHQVLFGPALKSESLLFLRFPT